MRSSIRGSITAPPVRLAHVGRAVGALDRNGQCRPRDDEDEGQDAAGDERVAESAVHSLLAVLAAGGELGCPVVLNLLV